MVVGGLQSSKLSPLLNDDATSFTDHTMTLDTANADKWTSLALFALGLAMLIGGFTMDRLEIRQIHPASIPGLVPMMLGAAMMLCSLLLYLSARRTNQPAIDADGVGGVSTASSASLADLGFAALYSIIYAIFLVGSMPFALATAIYIAVFHLHFTWKQGVGNASAQPGKRALHFAFGVGFAALAAYAISSLFQYGFLVRLP